MKGVLIVGHGSREAAANDEFEAFVAAYAERNPGFDVAYGYVELARPALVDALRARKPGLAETMVYDNPPGGHTFDRRVDPKTWQPENTREQRDSWNRVWTFLDWNLDPFHK